MNKETQLPPGIEFSYPAEDMLCRAGEWQFEKETPFAYKKGEEQELCHVGSEIILENFETNEEISGRIAGIYRFRLVKCDGKPGHMAAFLFRVKTDGGEEILYPMWQRPENLFLKDAETGRNVHFRATEESKMEGIREVAKAEAERWFKERPLAKARELGEEEGVIRGYLFSDYYLGDAWNRVAAVRSFIESPELQEEFLAGRLKEDFLEKERLTFFFMLKTIKQAPYIPQEAKVVFNQLAEMVSKNKWSEIGDIEKLNRERGKITEFVKEKWGEDLRAADDHLNKRLLSES